MDRKIKIVEWLLRAGVGGIFLYAAIPKIVHPLSFLEDVRHYRLVDGWMAIGVAFYLPWVELISSLGILLKKGCLGSLWILLGLTMIFLLALSSAWARGLNIDCGCFGGGHGLPDYPLWITRDILILGGTIFLLWIQFKIESFKRF